MNHPFLEETNLPTPIYQVDVNLPEGIYELYAIID
jgi:hypothetical protein